MFHNDTQLLIDRWTGLAQAADVRAGVPARGAFHPEDLGLRLPRAFIAERRGDDFAIHLAGGWVETFHGQPLRGRNLLDLWRGPSRPLVAAALFQAEREARPVVIAALAGSVHASLEIVVTPLRDRLGRPDLILGLYAPLATLTLAAETPRLLTARATTAVGPVGRPQLSLAAVHGRRVA